MATLTTEELEAVEQAAIADMNEDISKAAKGRLVTLIKAAAGVKADIAASEAKAALQLTLDKIKK